MCTFSYRKGVVNFKQYDPKTLYVTVCVFDDSKGGNLYFRRNSALIFKIAAYSALGTALAALTSIPPSCGRRWGEGKRWQQRMRDYAAGLAPRYRQGGCGPVAVREPGTAAARAAGATVVNL